MDDCTGCWRDGRISLAARGCKGREYRRRSILGPANNAPRDIVSIYSSYEKEHIHVLFPYLMSGIPPGGGV
jgi:hypothetical protein